MTEKWLLLMYIYFHPQSTTQDRIVFGSKLGEEVRQFQCSDYICCGDFNVILDPNKDATLPQQCYRSVNKAFCQTVDVMEWIDTYRTLNPLSRQMSHLDARLSSGKRLDYIFVLGSFVNELIAADIHTKTFSDHNPVSIQLSFSRNPKGRGYWRFPDPLLKNQYFVTYMKQCLQSTVSRHAHDTEASFLLDTVKCSIQGDTCDFLKKDGLEDKIQNECFAAKLAKLHKLWDSASPAQRKVLHPI